MAFAANPVAALLVACGAAVLLDGCAAVGPPTLPRDRFDYVQAISDSWKRQMLQNLVKIRYVDAPVFLDVTSVINAYSLDGNVSANGQVALPGRGDYFAAMGAGIAYSDKPTITYTPLAGDKFARSLMTPLPISGVLYLLQSGYPAGPVLRVCANSISGLDNSRGSRGDYSAGDPRFARLLEALSSAQTKDMIGIRQKSPKDKEAAAMYFRVPPGGDDGTIRTIRELLDLDPNAKEIEVAYGAFPTSRTEMAIVTRSTLQVMTEFASYIDVSAAETADGRVYTPPRSPDELRLFPPLIHVHSGDAAPADSFASVRYRNQWFWIDDRDVPSKTALNFLMLLFSLTETGTSQAGAPVVTVPAR